MDLRCKLLRGHIGHILSTVKLTVVASSEKLTFRA